MKRTTTTRAGSTTTSAKRAGTTTTGTTRTPAAKAGGRSRIDEARRVLLEKRAELLGRRQALRDGQEELLETTEADWEDAAASKTASAALAHLSDLELLQLRRITSALERLARGTYGTCISCGDPIPAGRLDVMPEAPTCAECAAS